MAEGPRPKEIFKINTALSTVILANPTDARFGQDFSTLLQHLRLEWVVLDKAARRLKQHTGA